MKEKMKTAAIVVIVLVMAGFAMAEVAMTVSNVSWLNPMWGSPAAAPTAENEYVMAYVGATNPGVVRVSPAGTTGSGSTSFPGTSITVEDQCRFLIKQLGGEIASIGGGSGDLIANEGSRISFAGNYFQSGVITLDVGQLVLSSSTLFDFNDSDRDCYVAGAMTGSGHVLFAKEEGHESYRSLIRFADIFEYSGSILVGNLIDLDFDCDYTFSGVMCLNDNGTLKVDQILAFETGCLIANGTVIADGQYSGASLAALNASLSSDSFVDGGGMLIVGIEGVDLSDVMEPELIVVTDAANELCWETADNPFIADITYYVQSYSKPTSEVTDADPNFDDPANTIVFDTNPTSPYALTLDPGTTCFWQIISNVVWTSNEYTGRWTDAYASEPASSTLLMNLEPLVTAGQTITTPLANLPIAGLSGTVSDEDLSSVAIAWDIIAGPGFAPNTAKQSLERAGDYTGDAAYNSLLKDWIGTDARTGIKAMTLTLSNLPAGTYAWKSWHHDTQDQTGLFDLKIVDAAGTHTQTGIDISNGQTVPLANVTKATATITADGTSDVVLTFTAKANDPVNQAFFVMNGFELSDGGDSPLKVDFGNCCDMVLDGFVDYTASHEVSDEFTAFYYPAFGEMMVGVTPSWDYVAARVVDTTVNNAAPTGRFETITNEKGTYTVQLTATDSEDTPQSGSDRLTVIVQ